MIKTDTIAELAKALSKFQGEVKPAKKDATNPFFKAKYTDLAGIWDVCREPLSRNGLSLLQLPQTEGGTIKLTTMLLHSSGEWISSEMSISPVKNDPQGIGSALTYARRYAMSAVLGIASEEDDDAEAALGRATGKTTTAASQTTTELITDAQQKKIYAVSRNKDIVEEVKAYMASELGKAHTKDLNKAQASQLIEAIEGGKITKNPLLRTAVQEGAKIDYRE